MSDRVAAIDVGVEWIVNASGCDAAALRDVSTIARLFQQLITELALHPVAEPVFHQFPEPGGVTGFVILSESHLACHTYPVLGVATFNLYCCRPPPEWPWRERLAHALGASELDLLVVPRRITAIEE